MCYPMQVSLNRLDHGHPGLSLAECVKSSWDVGISANSFVPRQLLFDSVRSVTIHSHLLQLLETEDRFEVVQLGHSIIDSLLANVCCRSLFLGSLGIFVCL